MYKYDVRTHTFGNPIVKENKDYIPKELRPKWCIKKFGKKELSPEFRCLCDKNDNRCPFFSMTDADKKDYKLFMKAWWKHDN